MTTAIEVSRLRYAYDAQDGGETHIVFDGLDLSVRQGSFVAILGHNGCGKSTLAKHFNAVLLPSGGSVHVYGMDTKDEEQLLAIRQHVGMVFQNPDNQIVSNVVEEDVAFAPENLGVPPEEIRRRVDDALKLVGMYEYREHAPHLLSGGQKQRVAIARALAANPKVLLCDEATSALDPKTTRQILELIRDINRQLGITVVVITHQMSVVKEICTHVAILDDGEVVEDGMVSTVFSAPRSQAARHLVFPGGADAAVSDPSQERRIRLIFRSAQTTAIPMVARLAAEESIYANVISASTQKLSEEIYGSMLLGVPRGQLDRAMGFFRSIPNLQAEEVSVDVH